MADALPIAEARRTPVATGLSSSVGADEAKARLLTPGAQFSGQLVNLAASLAFYFVMRSSVPTDRMTLWVGINVLCLGALLATDLAYYWVGKTSEPRRAIWRKVDLAVASANEIAAVATIFLLLPFAHSEQLMFATAYFVGYFPCSILADPGNVAPNRNAMLFVLSAFAGLLFFSGGHASKALAGMVLAYAAFLFFAIGGITRVVREAIAARTGMEQANTALNRALGEVSAERDAKTRFIATASHDLGQPLQAARLFGDQVAAASTGAAPTRAVTGLLSALDSAQAMLSHMLYHMRLEADAVTPHPVELRLGDVLTKLQQQTGGSAIEIRVVPSSVVVRTDPVLLERAIGNLIHNALVHSGGSRILLGVRRSGASQRIWVIDNGAGIASADAATLFDDYSQGAEPRTQTHGGFGLGLASVLRIARLLGGRAWLAPRRGTGAAFCFELRPQGPT